MAATAEQKWRDMHDGSFEEFKWVSFRVYKKEDGYPAGVRSQAVVEIELKSDEAIRMYDGTDCRKETTSKLDEKTKKGNEN